MKLGDWASRASPGDVVAGVHKERSHHQGPELSGCRHPLHSYVIHTMNGSPLGLEERATDPARERVRGTVAFNLEMLVTDQTSVVFQTLVL